MKLLDSMAFDAADSYCDCKEDEPCVANAYMEGYKAGFRKAREMAANLVYNYDTDSNDHVRVNCSNAIEEMGEEEVG
jgi:hypothetical protein